LFTTEENQQQLPLWQEQRNSYRIVVAAWRIKGCMKRSLSIVSMKSAAQNLSVRLHVFAGTGAFVINETSGSARSRRRLLLNSMYGDNVSKLIDQF
jgi:hypothetical protein